MDAKSIYAINDKKTVRTLIKLLKFVIYLGKKDKKRFHWHPIDQFYKEVEIFGRFNRSESKRLNYIVTVQASPV